MTNSLNILHKTKQRPTYPTKLKEIFLKDIWYRSTVITTKLFRLHVLSSFRRRHSFAYQREHANYIHLSEKSIINCKKCHQPVNERTCITFLQSSLTVSYHFDNEASAATIPKYYHLRGPLFPSLYTAFTPPFSFKAPKLGDRFVQIYS